MGGGAGQEAMLGGAAALERWQPAGDMTEGMADSGYYREQLKHQVAGGRGPEGMEAMRGEEHRERKRVSRGGRDRRWCPI